jgi:hydroxylamine reductase
MFCNQCEEANKGEGCINIGVCGKNDEVSNLQDLLIYALQGISNANTKLNKETQVFMMNSLFSCVTNVNFDKDYFIKNIKKAIELRDKIISKGIQKNSDFLTWKPENDEEVLLKSKDFKLISGEDDDIKSLKEILLYGIKGISAYAKHAYEMGYSDNQIFEFIQKALIVISKENSVDELINLIMECGSKGVKTMELLDKAHVTSFGIPEATKVNTKVGKNPGILISGHDLKDLHQLLEQTKNSGVDVYTHCEMLPAHAYPKFKGYENFIGNYGNSWWKQNEEFEKFNGPILMTTNCITPPKNSYKERLYTTGVAGFEGVKHIKSENGKKDFSQIIEHAKKCSSPTQLKDKDILTGFSHNFVLSIAEKIINAIKSGEIKRFVVMAGCDGRKKQREYYTEFAKELPEDTVILTAGCAKYRYNKLGLGDINGIPRVIDAGQCNDSYSLVVIAQKLAEVFELDDINKLPISYNIAWYEQKAVLVLLALLSLGVKNIMLGPKLPAFVSQNILNVLVDKFNISGVSDVRKDLEKSLTIE